MGQAPICNKNTKTKLPSANSAEAVQAANPAMIVKVDRADKRLTTSDIEKKNLIVLNQRFGEKKARALRLSKAKNQLATLAATRGLKEDPSEANIEDNMEDLLVELVGLEAKGFQQQEAAAPQSVAQA